MQCMEIWGGNDAFDNHVVMPGLDVWVFSQPFGDSAAGGDVYYVSSCATGRITRLLVADVTGHGQVARAVAGELRRLMRQFVNYIEQTRFVRQMNRHFSDITSNGGFATAVVSTFFAPSRRLTLCNAGHPPPLHYHATDNRWTILETDDRQAQAPVKASKADLTTPANLPLGIVELADYEQFSIVLDVGDLVLCYTDSLVEACGPDGCTMLGMQGLLDCVNGMPVGEVGTFINRLSERIVELAEGNLRKDDVTVLLIRPNGQSAAAPLGQRLLAPLRIARQAVRSLFDRDTPAPLPEMTLANLGGALMPGGSASDPFVSDERRQ